MSELLEVASVIAAPEAQPRADMNWMIVREYQAELENGATFPPVTVFYDGVAYYLADGFHRLAAAKDAGFEGIEAEIKKGGLRDAVLYSVGSNADHGLQRTNEDKRKAVLTLLNDPEWVQWSDREIARQCKVSNRYVSNIRPSVNVHRYEEVKVNRGNSTYTQKKKKENKKPEPEALTLLLDTDAANEPKQVSALAELKPEIQVKVAEKVATGEAQSVVDAKRILAKEQVSETTPPSGKYRVIYADPPWSYGNSGAIGSDNYGRAERHYQTMSTGAICDLPIKDITETNAVLFLWVTSPLLEEAFHVINAWGFKYKSSFVWHKLKHNFAHYNSMRHEFLLVATKGSCTPDHDKLIPSVIEIERTKNHSEKPEYFREMIDLLYPHGNRIELFSRTEAEGWHVWGNQTGQLAK